MRIRTARCSIPTRAGSGGCGARQTMPAWMAGGLEGFDAEANNAAFAAGTAALKSKALRSHAAVHARVRPIAAEKALRPVPSLRPAGGGQDAQPPLPPFVASHGSHFEQGGKRC
mmetsp:Transcript_92395/g.298628  ORF Transcript_92395/g.298628 Transcript_92395/m.298628 type:complete len:114 (+) Transcript_92395:125-466(+)